MSDGGFLKVILGPMFSGKTTELIRIYRRYSACDIPVCVINHVSDKKRYSTKNMSSHNNEEIMSYNFEKLYHCIEEDFVHKVKVILINEGQFFDDLIEVVDILVNIYKKEVYVCGLDGDFKRQKFGKILDLIPNCDEVVKLKALCRNCCKNDALFTFRLSKETEQTVVGVNNYMSLCRKCYNDNGKYGHLQNYSSQLSDSSLKIKKLKLSI
jgi:thymidine kinase